MTVRSFVARTFLWLAPCFAAWYAIGAWQAAAAGWLAKALVGVLRPGLLGAVERSGSELSFVTAVELLVSPGRYGVVALDVNGLMYTFGAPLFVALMFASRSSWRAIALGCALLLPLQAWGIAFDFLAQLLRHGPQVAASAGLVGWRVEGVVFGYQLGMLILPGLAPIAAWAAFNRPFIASLESSPRAFTAARDTGS